MLYHQEDVVNIYKRLSELQLKGKVLVHCAMGVSRSATVVIMFLMVLLRLPFELAFHFVKTQRPEIDPNKGFVAQLKSLESNRFQF